MEGSAPVEHQCLCLPACLSGSCCAGRHLEALANRNWIWASSVPWLQKWTPKSILDNIHRCTSRTLSWIFPLCLAPMRYHLGTASSLTTPILTPPRKDIGKLNQAWQRKLKLARAGEVSLGEEAEGLGLAHAEEEVAPGWTWQQLLISSKEFIRDKGRFFTVVHDGRIIRSGHKRKQVNFKLDRRESLFSSRISSSKVSFPEILYLRLCPWRCQYEVG